MRPALSRRDIFEGESQTGFRPSAQGLRGWLRGTSYPGIGGPMAHQPRMRLCPFRWPDRSCSRCSSRYGPAKLQQVCQEIALLQYLCTLMDHGEHLAEDFLKKNPV